MARTITVDLGARSYEILVGPGLLEATGRTVSEFGAARQAVVISADGVPAEHPLRVLESLKAAGLIAEAITFSARPTSEAVKNLKTVNYVLDSLFDVEPAIDRGCALAAVGGGVVGDVVGFVAAVALRGLRFIQCPTTLLAAVDSSVGGKTGVNHPAGKNLIGAFHQPRAVLIDTDTLKTLPAEELRNGLAECVKHAVIRDASLMDFIETHARAILSCKADIMTELIARNVAIKAAVVAEDERESGVRSHLNFGHTIGHAVEALVGYDKITHGQAVALGMVAANHMAVTRGLIDAPVAERVKKLLERLGLPVRMKGLDADGVWRMMQHDKKARGGQIRMVLPTGAGEVDIFADIAAGEVQSAVAAIS